MSQVHGVKSAPAAVTSKYSDVDTEPTGVESDPSVDHAVSAIMTPTPVLLAAVNRGITNQSAPSGLEQASTQQVPTG